MDGWMDGWLKYYHAVWKKFIQIWSNMREISKPSLNRKDNFLPTQNDLPFSSLFSHLSWWRRCEPTRSWWTCCHRLNWSLVQAATGETTREWETAFIWELNSKAAIRFYHIFILLKGQGWMRGNGNKKVSITFTTLPGTPRGTVIVGYGGHRCPEERQLLMPAHSPPPSCCSDTAESSECICQRSYTRLQIYYTASKWEIQNFLCWAEILFCNSHGSI